MPTTIGGLSSLRKLFLEYNHLESLPSQIVELKKLLVLILHNNNLKTLPVELKEMRHLLRLSLQDNPLDEATLNTIKNEGALALLKPTDVNERYDIGTISGTGTLRKYDTFRRNARKSVLPEAHEAPAAMTSTSTSTSTSTVASTPSAPAQTSLKAATISGTLF